jgi:hypothetical protein
MNEKDHKLILDYWDGRFQPRCGCGRWQQAPSPIKLQKLREVYDRIEDEHFRHVAEAERRQRTPS